MAEQPSFNREYLFDDGSRAVISSSDMFLVFADGKQVSLGMTAWDIFFRPKGKLIFRSVRKILPGVGFRRFIFRRVKLEEYWERPFGKEYVVPVKAYYTRKGKVIHSTAVNLF